MEFMPKNALPPPPPLPWRKSKDPDIGNCPCCKANTVFAKPNCIQTRDGSAELAQFILQWKCDVCGCEWVHGQFMADAKKKSHPFISICEGGKITIDGHGYKILSVTESTDQPEGRYTIEIQAE
jgi:hypothetical protein